MGSAVLTLAGKDENGLFDWEDEALDGGDAGLEGVGGAGLEGVGDATEPLLGLLDWGLLDLPRCLLTTTLCWVTCWGSSTGC